MQRKKTCPPTFKPSGEGGSSAELVLSNVERVARCFIQVDRALRRAMFFLPGEAGIFPASSDGALDPPTEMAGSTRQHR
jgi:hypothetical protein